MSTLSTEKVTENVQWIRPGRYGETTGMSTVTFWIAYPPHVGALGLMSDRVSRATGRGATRQAALDDVRGQAQV